MTLTEYEDLRRVLLERQPLPRGFWLSRTVEERLVGVELLRQIIYNYDPATAKVRRVLEVRDFPGGDS